MEQLAVVELIEKAQAGVTEPYLCRLADQGLYYVKGRGATQRGLVSELVSALLGREFGLPIPKAVLATVSSRILEFQEPARTAIGPGLAFASAKEGEVAEVTASSAAILPIEFQARLFLFDYWICNEDRSLTTAGGNPNLYLRLPERTPVVIDHNLAFDPHFDLAKNKQLHVCRSGWEAAKGDLLLPRNLRDEMLHVRRKVPAILEHVPTEWLANSPNSLVTIQATLDRCLKDDFWEELN